MPSVFPRTVSVKRPKNPGTAVGDQGFSGNDPVTEETTILSSIPASISYKGKNYRNPADLPTDSRGVMYLIVIPSASAALGSIAVNDVVVDDLGQRYRVSSPDWQILGFQLICDMLNV